MRKKKLKVKAESGKKMKDGVDLIRKATDKLLKLMGTKALSEVMLDEENDSVNINIKAEDEAGLLIGNRGVTLYSIQTILTFIIQRQISEWKRVVVNIADWREKEERKLRELAYKTSERVKSTGEPQSIYNLTSAQRRIVHITLSEEQGIKTESVGEGKDRYLVISSK